MSEQADQRWPGETFRRTTLPGLGKEVLRLGLAGNYGVQTADIAWAAERGVNFWVWTPRFKQVTPALRPVLGRAREEQVVAMLGVAYTAGMVRRGVEGALRALGTEYLDAYLLSWLGKFSFYSGGIQKELLRLKEEGKVRCLGVSIHDRVRAGELARDSILDLLMVRYNAKHPGAEQDIFPHLRARNPALVSYTATSWRQLLKPIAGLEMPPWPGAAVEDGAAPPPLSAPLCYRFCLSNPNVHVTLCGPGSRGELEQNLAALEAGPLSPEEDAWVREYGKKVKARKKLPYL